MFLISSFYILLSKKIFLFLLWMRTTMTITITMTMTTRRMSWYRWKQDKRILWSDAIIRNAPTIHWRGSGKKVRTSDIQWTQGKSARRMVELMESFMIVCSEEWFEIEAFQLRSFCNLWEEVLCLFSLLLLLFVGWVSPLNRRVSQSLVAILSFALAQGSNTKSKCEAETDVFNLRAKRNCDAKMGSILNLSAKAPFFS